MDQQTSHIEHVAVEAMDPRRFASIVGPEERSRLLELVEDGARELAGRVIWNVNSTAKGGGVVELLRPLLGYSRGGGVDARWVVISGEADFFDLTKRLHNRLHGFKGDGGPLEHEQHELYERTLSHAAAELAPMLRPRDLVILHDPQTAGLVEAVRQTGAIVIWRCHIGLDEPNDYARSAWRFLRDYVSGADMFVFSRPAFVWEGLPHERVSTIQPSIDAFSPKNAEQMPEQTEAILARTAIVSSGGHSAHATFTRWDGTPGRVDRQAMVIEDQDLTQTDRLVTQISRWDRLKDPAGVLGGFAEYISEVEDVHLLLAGPSVESVADDPEGGVVLREVVQARARLPHEVRERVHLASLPMDDSEENAAIVNALQRHSEIVVQKSIAEGFGLTVAEAMWKHRPVVASRIGGIQDQIVDGESGVLIDDPRNPEQFGRAAISLLRDRERAHRIGEAAHARVRDRFLGPAELRKYLDLIRRLISERERR
jgi:trehalose synthase